MMVRSPAPRVGRDAGALRFLLILLGGWSLLRVTMLWSPGGPAVAGVVRPPWEPPALFAAPMPRDFSFSLPVAIAGFAAPAKRAGRSGATLAHRAVPPAVVSVTKSAGGAFGADQYSLRLALMARRLSSGQVPAPRAISSFGRSELARGLPTSSPPFWMERSLSGWSLAGWLYLRDGSGGAPGGIAAASQLGGSQAGARVAYGFGGDGRLRAYGRATIAIEQRKQRELAFGLSFAPIVRLPVDVAVEQRVAVGRDGRTALAATVSGGVSEVALPAGFRLDAYAQAGVVGVRRRDGFADGAVVVDHALGPDEHASFRLGALAAGAVQPGVSRVDVGPRLTLKLPDVGRGSRIALDWRQRVAGAARPESGVALTLATDF